jgi:hypothetical protein
VRLSFFEAFVDTFGFDRVASPAASHEVRRVFLTLASAWKNEIDGHDQGIFEARFAVKPAVTAAVTIPF